MAAAPKLPVVTLGQSRRFTLRDVAVVATEIEAMVGYNPTLSNVRSTVFNRMWTGKARLELEKVVLDGLEAPKDPPCPPLPSIPTNGQDPLSPLVGRGIVVARLTSLMQGRAKVRAEALIFLAELLNHGVAPCFQTGLEGQQLAALVKDGQGKGVYQGATVSLPDLLARLSLSPVSSLSSLEVSSLSSGLYTKVGPAALEAYGTWSLMQLSDAVAAVSCEVYKAFTEPYQSVHFDICRPHRGQMTSASNLRLCLEGSSLVNTRKSDKQDPRPIRCIPQIHGAAREMIEASVKALELELNSAESGPTRDDAKSAGTYDSTVVDIIRNNLQTALGVLQYSSSERLALIGGTALQLPPSEGEVAQASITFATELSAGLLNLKAQSDAVLEAAREKEERGAQAKAVPEGEVGGEGGAAKEVDPKVEAKRKAKAEAAAAKAAAKAAKKKRGLVVGLGVTELRDKVVAITGGDLRTNAVAGVLDPYSSWAMGEFMLALYERLGSGGQKRKPKIAKGTRDFGPEQMLVREEAFGIIRSIFKRHGAVEIDTPVFELKETLTGKYGEDSKLIYDLADQGGELLSLRYDLTVPFARFLAMANPGNIKRYHIAKVYRRDNPAMARGRFREFYQCDFDVAGTYPTMVPDAEVITVATEILSSLPIGSFLIKLNHRKLLDSIFDISGVPPEKFRTICSAVDKLDKEPWENVKREMTDDKGLKEEVADRIGTFVQLRGKPRELHHQMVTSGLFGNHEVANAALDELKLLFDYLDAMGSLDYISLDMSLARGLDYYTGVIYEAVITSGTSQVGSIAAGGRYDNLAGMFSVSGQQTPCVGVSIGIERVLTIMEQQTQGKTKKPPVQVLVATVGNNMLVQRMSLAKELWNAGIPAQYLPQENVKLNKQLQYALEEAIPFMVIVGESEMAKGVVQVKALMTKVENMVPRSEMVASLIEQGAEVVTYGNNKTTTPVPPPPPAPTTES